MKNILTEIKFSRLFSSFWAWKRHINNPIDAVPTLEFRIPISPNEKYMRMLRYFMESLQTFAGPIARSAHCVVSIGADEDPRDMSNEYPWVNDYSLEFEWVDRELFCKDSYEATGYHRMGVKSDADIVALVDVDLLFTGDFDKIILQSYEKKCILGFIAHGSPFPRSASSKSWWKQIFDKANLAFPEKEFEYTAWGLRSNNPGDPDHRYTPVYYNYGVIIAPRTCFELMNETFVDDVRNVDAILESWFKSQIANTLSIFRHNIPYETLPLKYNFPLHVDDHAIRVLNQDPEGEDCVEDINIFHYLGDGEVNKEDFSTNKSLEELLQRSGLSDAGRCFQYKLRIIHERIANSDRAVSR